jgi:hypothetical protein
MHVSDHPEILKYDTEAVLVVRMPHRLEAEEYPLGPWTDDPKKLWAQAQDVFDAETGEALGAGDYHCFDTRRIHREVANALGLH